MDAFFLYASFLDELFLFLGFFFLLTDETKDCIVKSWFVAANCCLPRFWLLTGVLSLDLEEEKMF